jgi:aspartokinase
MTAARRAAELNRQGHRVVIVVSAQGDTTDELIEKAAQVNKRRAAREMDAYLSAGEQMSAGLMSMAIGAMGCGSVSLAGWQAGRSGRCPEVVSIRRGAVCERCMDDARQALQSAPVVDRRRGL